MQHVCINTLKIYRIQFNVLQKAKNLTFSILIPRLRNYFYSTFESQLSCSFFAIYVNFIDFVIELVKRLRDDKNVSYLFYVDISNKTYVSIIEL